jgi:hypothetical protein
MCRYTDRHTGDVGTDVQRLGWEGDQHTGGEAGHVPSDVKREIRQNAKKGGLGGWKELGLEVGREVGREDRGRLGQVSMEIVVEAVARSGGRPGGR